MEWPQYKTQTTVWHMRARSELVDVYSRHVNAGMARIFDLSSSPLELRSEGCVVFDEHDHAYLDCGGYCVFLLGHCHPDIVAAVTRAVNRHPLATRLLFEPLVAEAAEALSTITPAGLDYVWFANSGAEAVEAALKLCRLNQRYRVVAAHQAFHGKTMGALSLTGKEAYRAPFEPLLGDVVHVPFADVSAVENEFAAHRDACALFIEPIQSEGGVRIPAVGYLAELRELCDSYGALFVADEISTGFGRLGTWWGVDAEGVIPDILLAGKALGGGVVPVSAMVAKATVFEPLNRDPLLHTSTCAGSPLAAAAVLAAIGAAVSLQVPAIAGRVGHELLHRLQEIVTRVGLGLVRDVRGRGLIIGIECEKEHYAAEMMIELLGRRVIVAHSLNSHCVVRLTPPAILSAEELDWLVGAMEESLIAVADRYGLARQVMDTARNEVGSNA